MGCAREDGLLAVGARATDQGKNCGSQYNCRTYDASEHLGSGPLVLTGYLEVGKKDGQGAGLAAGYLRFGHRVKYRSL